MKKGVLLFAMLFSGMSLMAQKATEIVYLKNGSVIRGEVIEQVPGQSLKVQTRDGSIFVYQMDEVERISKEQVQSSSGKYDHGHKGLDVSFEGGVLVNKGGSANGLGSIEIGKRFNQNFYWGVGAGAIGGGNADVQIPINTTFKGLFPVNRTGIAPNIAFRTSFVYNTGGGESYPIGGRTLYETEAHHAMQFSLMPGIQIPIGQKVDFNLNLGYACTVVFDGGTSHSFMATAGFGFHKPWEKVQRTKAPTRNSGLQFSMEGGVGMGAHSLFRGGGALVLSYKLNPHVSAGLGYGPGFIKVSRKELRNSSNYEHDQRGVFHTIFLRGQYRLTDKRLSPFASADLGLRLYDFTNLFSTVPWSFDRKPDSKKNGFLFAPAVGASLRTTNNSYLELKVGYNLTSGVKDSKASDITYEGAGLCDFFASIGFTYTMKCGGKNRK